MISDVDAVYIPENGGWVSLASRTEQENLYVSADDLPGLIETLRQIQQEIEFTSLEGM